MYTRSVASEVPRKEAVRGRARPSNPDGLPGCATRTPLAPAFHFAAKALL